MTKKLLCGKLDARKETDNHGFYSFRFLFPSRTCRFLSFHCGFPFQFSVPSISPLLGPRIVKFRQVLEVSNVESLVHCQQQRRFCCKMEPFSELQGYQYENLTNKLQKWTGASKFLFLSTQLRQPRKRGPHLSSSFFRRYGAARNTVNATSFSAKCSYGPLDAACIEHIFASKTVKLMFSQIAFTVTNRCIGLVHAICLDLALRYGSVRCDKW